MKQYSVIMIGYNYHIVGLNTETGSHYVIIDILISNKHHEFQWSYQRPLLLTWFNLNPNMDK